MRIYHVRIQNFRGIRSADFNIDNPIVCFIGAGDSTKSTILDAIEYVLSPNWFIPFDDSDFTSCDVSKTVVMEVTIGSVPDEFLSDAKFGLHLRGWRVRERKVVDEPCDDDIRVITIRLIVNENLIPEWSVVTDRTPDGIRISYQDRQRFGVARVGTRIDSELTWTRGSSLIKLTKERRNAEQILLEANRQLRNISGLNSIADFKATVEATRDGAHALGVSLPLLRADIDPVSLRASSAILSLHNESVPLRRLGLGSKRLVAIGAQLQCIQDGSILLVDEIEHALEPHRIKHLIRTLMHYCTTSNGQIIMTSHSPSTLEELGATPLYVVRNTTNFDTRVSAVRAAAQGTVRAIPDAFLSPRIVVCEGATEEGLLRAFERTVLALNGTSFAANRVIAVNGGGSDAPLRAKELREHGYDVCLFADSDTIETWKVPESQLSMLGVKVITWNGSVCTEHRIMKDIGTTDGLKGVIAAAIEATGRNEQSIIASINAKLVDEPLLTDISAIDSYSGREDILRKAMSEATVIGGSAWFKTVRGGEILGDFLFETEFAQMTQTDFYKKLMWLKQWSTNG